MARGSECASSPVLTHVRLRSLLAAVGLLVSAAPAQVLVHADGRREAAANPRRDSKGRWTVEIEGRRVAIRGGEVVAILDKDGKETVIIPELAKTPPTTEARAMLASLHEPKNKTWQEAVSALAGQPSRAIVDDLAELAKNRSNVLRGRGIQALMLLRTRESVLVAAEAVLAEKNRSTREQTASLLFSVQEIFKRSDSVSRNKLVEKGIANRDKKVRYVFAMLAPPDMKAADEILAKEGLKDRDHHVRESAAVELARRGNWAGEKVLTGMLARSKLPGFGSDEALMTRYLIREQVEICELLGKCGTDAANAALQKATSSPHGPVQEAAKAALQRAQGQSKDKPPDRRSPSPSCD